MSPTNQCAATYFTKSPSSSDVTCLLKIRDLELEIERFERICAEFYTPGNPIIVETKSNVKDKKERPKVPPKPKIKKPDIIRAEESSEGTEV